MIWSALRATWYNKKLHKRRWEEKGNPAPKKAQIFLSIQKIRQVHINTLSTWETYISGCNQLFAKFCLNLIDSEKQLSKNRIWIATVVSPV